MNDNITKVIEQIVIWKKYKQLLYPHDVLNMMIEHGVVTETEVRDVIQRYEKKPVDIRLPLVYIGE